MNRKIKHELGIQIIQSVFARDNVVTDDYYNTIKIKGFSNQFVVSCCLPYVNFYGFSCTEEVWKSDHKLLYVTHLLSDPTRVFVLLYNDRNRQSPVKHAWKNLFLQDFIKIGEISSPALANKLTDVTSSDYKQYIASKEHVLIKHNPELYNGKVTQLTRSLLK